MFDYHESCQQYCTISFLLFGDYESNIHYYEWVEPFGTENFLNLFQMNNFSLNWMGVKIMQSPLMKLISAFNRWISSRALLSANVIIDRCSPKHRFRKCIKLCIKLVIDYMINEHKDSNLKYMYIFQMQGMQ